MIGWECSLDEGDRYIENFGGETSWKVAMRKTEKEIRG
jgi:hypothetical protein